MHVCTLTHSLNVTQLKAAQLSSNCLTTSRSLTIFLTLPLTLTLFSLPLFCFLPFFLILFTLTRPDSYPLLHRETTTAASSRSLPCIPPLQRLHQSGSRLQASKPACSPTVTSAALLPWVEIKAAVQSWRTKLDYPRSLIRCAPRMAARLPRA